MTHAGNIFEDPDAHPWSENDLRDFSPAIIRTLTKMINVLLSVFPTARIKIKLTSTVVSIKALVGRLDHLWYEVWLPVSIGSSHIRLVVTLVEKPRPREQREKRVLVLSETIRNQYDLIGHLSDLLTMSPLFDDPPPFWDPVDVYLMRSLAKYAQLHLWDIDDLIPCMDGNQLWRESPGEYMFDGVDLTLMRPGDPSSFVRLTATGYRLDNPMRAIQEIERETHRLLGQNA